VEAAARRAVGLSQSRSHFQSRRGRRRPDGRSNLAAALDDGTLSAATLDVFTTEPLPATSPLWSHPKVTLSPHNAAEIDADAISVYVAEQIARFERGETLKNVVAVSEDVESRSSMVGLLV
jgi:phosphoglycerate dehydrogenase-like enzyme